MFYYSQYTSVSIPDNTTVIYSTLFMYNVVFKSHIQDSHSTIKHEECCTSTKYSSFDSRKNKHLFICSIKTAPVCGFMFLAQIKMIPSKTALSKETSAQNFHNPEDPLVSNK